ncbi:AAA family ATPase [Vibrio rhizosphaerae]|uniref:AAA family ATPase n=1 Tax=Vibrio rhizosphaerae TaxID=398736 RepID=A0ABU4IS05_9VIBR|nr:AAA family ATPase [Vibrio rhizosphaerae]MDW6092201.1 AAA family ATPase [Vibrio rhizosphaerae]
MKTVILVNGIPASGKSTTANRIADYLTCPYLSIDTIKEPFMALYHDVDRNLNRRLGQAAYQVIWDTIAQAPDACVYVVDAWFGFRPKEELLRYVDAANIDHVIEVWNQVSPETVVERYKQRLPYRRKGHPGAEYLPELETLAQKAKPMHIGELIWLDQDDTPSHTQLLPEISARIAARDPVKKTINS